MFINSKRKYNKASGTIIRFFGKYSQLIYLLHWNIATKITPKLMIITNANEWGLYIERIIITYVVSIFVAFIAEKLFFAPCQKLLRKLLLKDC